MNDGSIKSFPLHPIISTCMTCSVFYVYNLFIYSLLFSTIYIPITQNFILQTITESPQIFRKFKEPTFLFNYNSKHNTKLFQHIDEPEYNKLPKQMFCISICIAQLPVFALLYVNIFEYDSVFNSLVNIKPST